MTSYFSLAPYYDLLTEDVEYSSFADYYEQIFKMRNACISTVLDLACGTGTLTYIMAERGYELIGVDASEEMLAVACGKASEKEVPVQPIWLNQTMQELDLYGTVDAAVCSLDGINYVPENELDSIFERLNLFIRPGGLFIFDINTPFKLRSLDNQMFIDENEDIFCVWRTEFDENKNACYYGMDIFSKIKGKNNWERSFEEHVEFAHEPDMLVYKLKAAGFENISVYNELGTERPKCSEQRVFIAAERGR